ncbi:alpha/beta fold hydrolase [Flavilitoribacter nigricans]|nr:alpha/beta hydrolase [Flavilitoribacter nigricans]
MKTHSLLLLLCALIFGACNKSEFLTEGDYFHLDHNGAKLPVWVKGNVDSGVFIITVHGGPGDSGHEFPLSKGFKYLEEDYAVVYWDQRFSGLSQGDPDDSNITPELFIEDTEKVVELIRHRYGDPTLFMLGHSWGGQLSAGYLGRDDHDQLFNGWIDLDGSIYGALEAQIMKDWILEQVPGKLNEEGSDKAFWQFVLDWYEAHPAPDNYTDQEPYFFADALDGYAYDWERTQELNPVPYHELIFSSMFSLAYYVSGLTTDQSWADDLNFTPELAQITIPSLLLWGKNDGAVPAAVGDYVYEHLATPIADKRLVKIDECSHAPHYDQPEIFYQQVVEFVEQYQ